MAKTMQTRYRRGVQWIAHNDEPTERETTWMVDMISIQVLADVFEKDPMQVAMDVSEYREDHDI